MPITSDLRGYADSAIEQGKQVVGQALERANDQINGLTGTARSNVTELTNRAAGVVTELRTQAEKTLNIEAIRSSVEPYLAQANQYRVALTERAEGLLDSVKSDERVAKAVSTAESLTGTVVGTVNERVVKPVSSLTGRNSVGPQATKAGKPATTRPVAKKAPAKAAGTPKTTAATPRSTPRKTAAKKAGPSSGS